MPDITDEQLDAIAASNLGDYDEGTWHRVFARAVLALSTPPAATPAATGEGVFWGAINKAVRKADSGEYGVDASRLLHEMVDDIVTAEAALAQPAPVAAPAAASEAVAFLREALEKIAELPVRHVDTTRIARAALEGIRHNAAPTSGGESVDAVLDALRELLASYTATYPRASEGQMAQTAWGNRQSAAATRAREILARAALQTTPQQAGKGDGRE